MIYYVLVDFGILLFSRFFTIFFLSGLVLLFTKSKLGGLKFKEIVLFGFAGLIRGSIAYAVIVKLAYSGEQTKESEDKAR